ncbi:hypothetical protein [Legionella resiliens]|uniref:Substrate of the Dot/Icm secretion system n=1 Tax=Legionella resiliens TaxID=2905958 RepID=A0ABS8WWZ0_9GAMM|nr:MULTISPECIES: hypothetical protein [unclassified Legionella]MCE0721856.1 hypothetical protein [Legionella sp. 9fVS26]MCE3531010.1 hypothetical protein [Legionella sp. 8cVS16]
MSYSNIDMGFGSGEDSNDSTSNEPTQVEVCESSGRGFTYEDYCDTDYNNTEKELQRDYGHLDSFYESSSESSSSSSDGPGNDDPWSGAKFLLSPLSSFTNWVITSLQNTEESTSKDELPERGDGNFGEVDYKEHQKNNGSSTNVIVKALAHTIEDAATISRQECMDHEFKCKERKKLHEKTGGVDNQEMAGVNVSLDKREKPLLPGARKELEGQAKSKQKTKKIYESELAPPSEAITHARNEFKIADEFSKGEDEFDKAGSMIHTAKGVAEVAALDLNPIEDVTSQPGFVTRSPCSNYLMKVLRERTETIVKMYQSRNKTPTADNDHSGTDESERLNKPSSGK